MKTINYTVDINTKTSSVKQGEKDVKDLGKTTKKVSKDATKNIDAMGGALNALPAPIQRIVMGFKTLKTAIASSGIGLFLVAAGALAGLFTAATKKGAEFAKQMSTLRAVSNASAEEMDALSASAKELGATTQFTAIQVGELQTEFAKMGFTTDQILASTKATLDLAASMEVDLASAAMLAGSTVNAFGLQAEDTQRVVDVLAKSTSSSALDFTSLQEALKNVSPAAKATGRTIEETSALLGVLANNGVKGGRAGTGLSKAFIELNKKGIPLNEALDKIKNSSNGLNTALGLAGNIGGRALLSLADKQGEIKDLTDQFNNAAGAAQAMAEVRLDNLAGDTTKLNSAWEGFLLSLEDGEGIFSKISRVFVQTLTAVITKITSLSRTFGAFTAEFEASTAFFKTYGVAFKSTFTNAKLILLGFKKVISEIPFIGKAIDKKQLDQDIKNIKNTYSQLIAEAAKLQKDAAERRKEGTFMERVANRIKVAENKIVLDKIEKEEEAAAEKQAELDEEALAKRKKAYQKYLAFRNKLVKRQEDFDDKTEEEKLARQKERDLKELAALKVSSKKKAEARLLIDKFYADKFLELENKKQAEAKKIEEAARLAREKKRKAEQARIDNQEVEDQLNFLQKKEDLENEYLNSFLDRQTQEENAVQDKYNNLIQKAIEYGEDTKILEDARQGELKAITDKYDQQQKEKDQEIAERNLQFTIDSLTQATNVISQFALMNQEKFDTLNAGVIEQQEELSQKILDNENLTNKQKEQQIAQLNAVKQRELDANNKRAEKAFKVQQAASIASALASTYLAAVQAYQSQFVPIPDPSSPIRGGIAAGLAVAAGLANVAQIKKQKFEAASFSPAKVPSQSVSSGGAGTGGGAGTSPSQAPQFNVVGQSGFNQVAGALGQQGPVQAFVVSGDVTTAQELQNNTITQATF